MKRYEWNEIAELNAFVCVCEGFKMSVSRPETGGMGGACVHKDGEEQIEDWEEGITCVGGHITDEEGEERDAKGQGEEHRLVLCNPEVAQLGGWLGMEKRTQKRVMMEMILRVSGNLSSV